MLFAVFASAIFTTFDEAYIHLERQRFFAHRKH